MKMKFYLDMVNLFYIWQWLAFCFDYSTELNIANFLQKYSIFMKYPKKFDYVLEVSQ